MEQSNYLPIGLTLGGHYEIIKQLGQNDISILYVVKDTHRRETLFVLSELFIKESSKRKGNEVFSTEASQTLFEKYKQETITQINLAQNQKKAESFEIYGYFKENKTIYTIMEFSNESNIERYFIGKPQPKIEETPPTSTPTPTPTPEPQKSFPEMVAPPKKKKSFFFLKMLLLFVAILVGLFIFSYKMIQEDKQRAKEKRENKIHVVVKAPIHHPPLGSKDDPVAIKTPTITSETNQTQERNTTIENNNSIEQNLTAVEIPIESNFDEVSVKIFLDGLVTLSIEGSVNKLVSYFDIEVDRYFSLRNVTHEIIYNDKVNYNKRWVYREFTILDFHILKAYRKGDSDYCDVKSTTHWNVSTKNFEKTASGVTTDFITLKKTKQGYKVKTIYTLK